MKSPHEVPRDVASGGQRRHARWVDAAALGGVSIAIVVAMVCVLCCPGVTVNRHTDATCHICVADEFARTGMFAKDPFLRDAPRDPVPPAIGPRITYPVHPTFGLWQWANGQVQRWSGLSAERVFVISNAFTTGLCLLFAYLAGVLATGSVAWGVGGLFSFLVMVVFGRNHTIFEAGWQFLLALSMYTFLMVLVPAYLDKAGLLATGRSAGSCLTPRRRAGAALMIGVFAGLMFDVQTFVGLFGGAVIGGASLVVLGLYGTPGQGRLIVRLALVAFLGFVVTAFPWLELHIELRSSLAAMNNHIVKGSVPEVDLLLLAGMAIGIGGMSVLMRRTAVCDSWTARMTMVNVAALLSLAAALPAVNHVIERATSSFMAVRVLWFVPGTLALAAAPVCMLRLKGWKGRVACGAVILAACVLLMPRAFHHAKYHVYLLRTHDFDTHPYQSLTGFAGCGLQGKIVLSDPDTSYFLRRFVGAYGLSVPGSRGSPLMDFDRGYDAFVRVIKGEDVRDVAYEYVLLNTRGRENYLFMLEEAPDVVLERLKRRHRLVYEYDGYVLFQR